MPVEEILRDQPGRQLDDRRGAQGSSGFCTRLGGFDVGKYLCRSLHNRRDQRCAYRSLRHRIHDRAGGVVSPNVAGFFHWLLSDRRRHSGDFPICVVPMLNQDIVTTLVPEWGYFCQISDSTTSFGSYSGAVPNEKITWGKLNIDTPKFIIESDATIVAPLIFAKVLGW